MLINGQPKSQTEAFFPCLLPAGGTGSLRGPRGGARARSPESVLAGAHAV